MGHTIIVDGTTPCITAHKSHIEVTQKLNQPKSAQDCKSFCGVVNFLSMYLKDLQSHLIPIYELTKKNRPFIWGEEQQHTFDLIKSMLVEPPVLVMPNARDPFQLYLTQVRWPVEQPYTKYRRECHSWWHTTQRSSRCRFTIWHFRT